MRYSEGKSGGNKKAICRDVGYSATVGALDSRTRSKGHTSATPYVYKGVSGYGKNENILGYSKGGGCSY